MKILLGRIGLVIFGVAAGLLLAEGAVRIFYPNARDAVIPGHLFAIDDVVGWGFASSKTSVHHSRYFDVPYAINAFGFRDSVRTLEKSPRTYRTILYGDSLIFGWGVKKEDRFGDLIENERKDLEIWNHAVPGYGLDQEIVLYEKEGEHLDADEVIFFVGPSTLGRIYTGYIFAKFKPMFSQRADGSLELVPVPKVKNAFISLVYEAFSPFYLPYFLQSRIATLQESLKAPLTTADSQEPQPRVNGFVKAMLRMARNTARRRNHRMTLLTVGLSPADRDQLRAFCDEIGAGFLEISSEVSPGASFSENGELFFGQYDKHWNARANNIIARQLLAQMQR